MAKKFLTIIGNRPQLIKYDKHFKKQIMVYTGQHYDASMKDVFFKGLKLPKPDYDLRVQDLGAMVDKIMKVIDKEKPQYLIVYGDTRSTLAGAMASLYKNIPLIHIEAGCRSFNWQMPEERIRTIVDDIAIIHFAPSEIAKSRLELNPNNITVYNVGATQIDSMFEYAFPTKKPKDAYKYIVATVHREANLEKDNLTNIIDGFSSCEKPIRFYCHPHTRKKINQYGIKFPKNVSLKDPAPYKKIINEIAFAEKIVTDSGGMQVEAYFLRRPCVTLRLETEWPETVESRWNKLVGTDSGRIASALKEKPEYGRGDNMIYGKGDAKKKIRLILNNL